MYKTLLPQQSLRHWNLRKIFFSNSVFTHKAPQGLFFISFLFYRGITTSKICWVRKGSRKQTSVGTTGQQWLCHIIMSFEKKSVSIWMLRQEIRSQTLFPVETIECLRLGWHKDSYLLSALSLKKQARICQKKNVKEWKGICACFFFLKNNHLLKIASWGWIICIR